VALNIQPATSHENFIIREKIGNNQPRFRTNKNLHSLPRASAENFPGEGGQRKKRPKISKK